MATAKRTRDIRAAGSFGQFAMLPGYLAAALALAWWDWQALDASLLRGSRLC